jgi:hypothetical protein
MKRLDPKGFSLVELCFAVLILAILAQSFVMARLVLAKKALSFSDHNYAELKANQIFNELQACSNTDPNWGGTVLDGYNDGLQYNLVLTADKAVTFPGDPLSGNQQAGGHWRFLRQVQVTPVYGPSQARLVVINIWRCASDGKTLVPGLLLTSLSGTITPLSSPTCTQTPQVLVDPYFPGSL